MAGSVNLTNLVKIPVQGETVVEIDRTGSAPLMTGRIKRTWFQFLLGLYNRGFWTPMVFAAGNFTASGTMAWTLTSPDQITYAFTQVGKMMTVVFWLNTTSVTAPLSNELRLLIPNSQTAMRYALNSIWLSDNGTKTTGTASVDADATYITIMRTDQGNYTAAVDTTYVRGQLTFEVKG